MKTTNFRYIIRLLLCTLPFFITSCNDEDEADIFIGKTWKITNLFASQNKPITTEEEAKTLNNSSESFYIKFDNESTFSGRTLKESFNGTWTVDLNKRTISFILKNTGNPTDALSKKVIQSIKNTIKYEGDYHYLRFNEEGSAYMLAVPAKQ